MILGAAGNSRGQRLANRPAPEFEVALGEVVRHVAEAEPRIRMFGGKAVHARPQLGYGTIDVEDLQRP